MQTYTDPTTGSQHFFPDDATPSEIDAATRPPAVSKPGPFKSIADAIYPPAPRAPEGILAPAARVVGAIAGAPQRAVENATGLGSGTTMGPLMQHFHDVMSHGKDEPQGPVPGSMDYRLESVLGMQHQNRAAPNREAYGEMGEAIAHQASDPLTYVGLPFAKYVGGFLRAARAGAKVAPEAAKAAEGVEAAVKAADDLELPLTALKGEKPQPWMGAPGPAKPPLWNQGPEGPVPSMGAPGTVDVAGSNMVAEDVIRARRATIDMHANSGTGAQAPVQPLPTGTGGWSKVGNWTRPITGMSPEDYTSAFMKYKSRLNYFFTPEDIARGNPAAMNIVREGFASSDAAHLIEQDMGTKLKENYKGLSATEITDVHRLLDKVPTAGPITPKIVQAAAGTRQIFDKLADMAGIPKQERLADYFPHLRDVVESTLNLKIAKTGGVITKEIPQDFKVFFQKPRTLPTDETIDYGTKSVNAYLSAAAKRISMKGGTLSDGRPVAGFLNRVADHLENLPDVPEIRMYFKQYVNDLTHGQKPGLQFITPQMAQTIKQVQFLRTIGANFTSAMQNVLQPLNTLAVTDIRSWGAAWYDILKNRNGVNDLARKTGLVDQTYSAHDLATMSNPNSFQSALTSAANKGGFMFKKAEETNRLHAFAAGYRDALDKGLAGDGAVEYAKNIVNQTQFRFGSENLPPWLRGGGAANALIGQYKSYQINQLMFLKNLALHDPKGMAKWLTAGALLGGPDVYGHPFGHEIRRMTSHIFGGNPEDYPMKGLVGGMGMWIGNQMGLGALPAEDMSSLAFLLPGPAIGHVLSVASAVSGKDLTFQGIVQGKQGQTLSPDQRASNATSSINVQLNRFRQALVMGRAQGPNFRQSAGSGTFLDPTGAAQSFGLTPPQGPATVAKDPGEIVRKVLGIPSEAQQTDMAKRQRVTGDISDYKDIVRRIAAAHQRGDDDEVRRLQDEGRKQFGRTPYANIGEVKRAVQATKKPALEREIKHAPKQIRTNEQEEAKY